ncbi:MAG: hypothetical protein KKF56_04330 [Nanoarchaeota archaeon]|nr:hypothetical protein [Nanoarchaeota archaeon]
MAAKKSKRIINLYITPSSFSTFFKKFEGKKTDYDFSELAQLRQLLSNEKSRILNILKTKSPDSIYSLAKILGRDFKSVRDDLKLLQKFGFIELTNQYSGKRKKLKPELILDELAINISFQ